MRPPPRLFVIPARDAPIAAVLCRGPSSWTQLIQWDTDRDVFADGAWFKGRIYEHECDLSPNGRLFLYACHQGSRLGTDYTDAWTAVSRLPWLHALTLWPAGTTYGGGGRFIDDHTVMLRTPNPRAHADHPNTRLRIVKGHAQPHPPSGSVDGAQWSGTDASGAVIYARDGVLFRRARVKDRQEDRVVRDLSGREPRPVPAPDWARDW